MNEKNSKGLICIIVILIVFIGYLLLTKKDNLSNTNNNSSTTTTNLSIIKTHEESSKTFAQCIKETSGLEETCNSFINPNEIKINYPVIEGNTNTIKTINNKILKDVNEIIKNAENNKDVNDESNSCDNIKILSTGITHRYEHFETLSFNVMPESNKYISIIEYSDIHSSCASGWFEFKNVYIYDKENDKEITQNDLNNKLNKNDLDNLYNTIVKAKQEYNETDNLDIIKEAIDNKEFYLYYDKNGYINIDFIDNEVNYAIGYCDAFTLKDGNWEAVNIKA